jgi:hypothetical protein
VLWNQNVIRYFDFLDYLVFLTFLCQNRNAYSSMTYPTVENKYTKILARIGI